MEYSVSGVNVVLSNPCVGPLPRFKIYLFLLSICTDELMSTPKLIASLPMKILNANRILCRSRYICIYLDEQLDLSLPDRNRQSFKVKLVFKSRGHKSNL